MRSMCRSRCRASAGAKARARLRRLTDAPGRQQAICQHFMRCGGCVAQHMSDDVYAGWKQDIIADAFHHRGIEAEIAPLVRVKANSRRRAYFGVERNGSKVIIGFREEGQHKLVDLAECPVLDPVIVACAGRFEGDGADRHARARGGPPAGYAARSRPRCGVRERAQGSWGGGSRRAGEACRQRAFHSPFCRRRDHHGERAVRFLRSPESRLIRRRACSCRRCRRQRRC